MNELIGRTLKNRYRIDSPLGEGAMGTVYRGVETESGRAVAIKVMHPALMKEPGMLTRFRREATAMRRVRHPNAIEVFAHGVEDGLVYLVMELAEGRDLAEHLHIERCLAPDRAARILADVLSALAEAHAHGVVHRDIKPENVMVGGPEGDTVKLIDFGIAKPTDPFGNSPGSIEDEGSMDDSIPDDVHLLSGFDLTTAGTLVGSPGYMAPEQWASRAVDARTDIYACGVLLYQLCTGRLPFDDENPFVLATRQLRETPPAPHSLNPKVHVSLSAIILRAIQPEPERRYQTAAEMCDALCAHLVERSITDTLQLGATLPLAVPSPFTQSAADAARLLPCAPFEATIVLVDSPAAPAAAPAGKTLPLPDERPTQPLPMPPPAPAASLGAEKTLPLDLPPLPELAPAPDARQTPVSPVSVALAVAPGPSRSRTAAALTATRARLVVPLAAAFLALGVLLGIVLFLPVL